MLEEPPWSSFSIEQIFQNETLESINENLSSFRISCEYFHIHTVEYMYAFAGKNDGEAYMIIQADDLEAAEAILSSGGFRQADIHGI